MEKLLGQRICALNICYLCAFTGYFLFTHSYLPAPMIETIIVPIVKNNCGNLCDSNNYRPIALATLISKLFESVILLKCETFLETCPNQFGFKKGHSTEMCIYVLKEMIEFYKSCNISVIVTFLDASKAYDKIDHCHGYCMVSYCIMMCLFLLLKY